MEEYNPSIDRFKRKLSLQITQNFYPKELIYIFNQLKRRTLYYNKSDFFQGLKPLKKELRNIEKNYFKSSIDP